MDKKINFWQFQGTTGALIFAIFGAFFGFLVYYVAKDSIPIPDMIGALCALLFYIISCLSAIHVHNSNIEKNIKDREKER